MSHEAPPSSWLVWPRQRGAVVAAYVVLGQAGWLACVLGAARGQAGIGLAVVALAVAFHLARVGEPRRELALLMGVAVLGWAWESALARAGCTVYPGGGSWAPAWLAALWALFALQLNVLFVWLRDRPWLAAALGAVQLPAPVTALAVLAAGWALLLPLLLALAARYDGVQRRSNR